MKNFDVGQIVGVMANIGVILGIIFLALEIDQNNDLLTSQTRANMFDIRAAMQRDFILNEGGIADLIYKERSGGELSDAEARRLLVRRGFILRNFEMTYEESPDIPLSESAVWSGYFETDPGLHDMWNLMKQLQNPEFVQWMDENVVDNR